MINYLKKEVNDNKKIDFISINCLNENKTEKEKNVTVYNFNSIEDFEKINNIKNCDVICYSGIMNYNKKELDKLKNFAYYISNKYNKLVTIGYWYIYKRTEEIHFIHIINDDETTNVKIPGSQYSMEYFVRNVLSKHNEILEQNKNNKPKKINFNELFLDSIDESNAIFKDELRKKKLVPILNGEVINTYEVQTTDKTYALISKYSEELSSICKTVTNDEQLINDIRFNSSKYSNFNNIKNTTKEELMDYYDIKDIYSLKQFLARKQNKMFRYDGLNYNEIIEAITKYYSTIYFKYESKLSEILLLLNSLVDIDFLAEQIYKFLYDEDISFRTGMNYMVEEFNINKFNNTEMNLSFENKVDICKEIIDSLDISCVHTFKPNELNNFLLYNIYHTNNIEELVEFAKHNSDIIHADAFNILLENKNSKQKRI